MIILNNNPYQVYSGDKWPNNPRNGSLSFLYRTPLGMATKTNFSTSRAIPRDFLDLWQQDVRDDSELEEEEAGFSDRMGQWDEVGFSNKTEQWETFQFPAETFPTEKVGIHNKIDEELDGEKFN